MMRRIQWALLLCLLCTLPLKAVEVPVPEPSWTAARVQFRLLYAQLDDLDAEQLSEQLKPLADYPLVDFLRYEWARKQLPRVNAQWLALREQIGERLLRERLDEQWRRAAVKVENWSRVYELTPEASDCAGLRAQVARGLDSYNATAKALYSRYRNPPAPCRQAFSILAQRGAQVPLGTLWAHIFRAVEKDWDDVAKAESAKLSQADRARVRAWQSAQETPAAALASAAWRASKDSLTVRARRDFLRRLARIDAAAAQRYWQAQGADPEFGLQLAQRAMRARAPGAQALVSAVFAVNPEPELAEDNLRLAVAAQDWPRVTQWSEQLLQRYPAHRSGSYWRLAAKQAQGLRVSTEQWTTLLDDDDWYAWLASAQLNEPWRPVWRVPSVDASTQKVIAADPVVRLVGEYLALGFPTQARRRWRSWAKTLSEPQQFAAARVAHQWGWHERALATHGCVGLNGPASLCFPRPYASLVKAALDSESGVDEDFVYAVMRQESRYAWDVGSHAGAQGLMQLMPSTAKWIAQRRKINYQRRQILKPQMNIRLGVAYLAWLQGRSAHRIEQAAGYNAGPGRLKQWRPQTTTRRDVWVESIPFDETRGYVQRVGANWLNYCAMRAQNCQSRLDALLHPAQAQN